MLHGLLYVTAALHACAWQSLSAYCAHPSCIVRLHMAGLVCLVSLTY